MEAALTGPSIAEEHRALIDTALQGFRSVEAEMREVFKGLFRSFEVRSFAFVIMNNLRVYDWSSEPLSEVLLRSMGFIGA